MKKVIVFVLALVIPVLIYLFMQGFGNNRYALPILYQDSVPEIEGCLTPDTPYRIPLDNYIERIDDTSLAVLFDIRYPETDSTYIKNELQRVDNYFGFKPFQYQVVRVNVDEAIENGDIDTAQNFAACILRNQSNKSFLTLVDKTGRIRSYYESDSRADFDRLITELEIIKTFETDE